MLTRLAVVVVLALTGASLPPVDGAPASGVHRSNESVAPIGVAASTAGEATVTQLEVVVPPVDESGEVVVDAEVRAAQAEPGVVVTDEVVTDGATTGEDVAGEDVAGEDAAGEDAAGEDAVGEDVEDAAVERVQSGVVETGEFQTLGVTWPMEVDGASLDIQVRTRAEGDWTEWVPLEPGDAAPDPGTADAENAVRGGTDALWVGDADAVQLSFPATEEGGPEGLSLALVDVPEIELPGTDGAGMLEVTGVGTSVGLSAQPGVAQATSALFLRAASPDLDVTTAPVSSTALLGEAVSGGVVPTALAPIPRIISRAEWGARPQVCTPDVASGGLVGAVVHHTAGSNNYSTVAQAMQQIRGDQAYHIDGRQWCDIGYNFIVDKWGNIYEGRANSLIRPVVGVHAGGFNTGTVGVSMLGTYTDRPSAQVQRSVGQIIGLRLSAYNVNPKGSMVYRTGTGENSRFQNQDVPLPRVFGHRDVAYTACPGNGGYAVLPAIREIAGAYFVPKVYRESQSVVRAMYEDILLRGADPTGLNTWSAMLAGGSGLPALVATLTNSDEYIRLRITRAYRDILGRAPEAAGLQNWYREIRAGRATVDDVARRFLSSQEFRTRSGGTDRGYVIRMYSTVLGRAAADSEVNHWTAEIRRLGRERVTDQIWFSMEAARYRAGTYYQTFLKRAAEPAGRDNWARVLLTRGEGAVRIGIAGSEEYRRRALVRYP